jgi:hypothetical protein
MPWKTVGQLAVTALAIGNNLVAGKTKKETLNSKDSESKYK